MNWLDILYHVAPPAKIFLIKTILGGKNMCLFGKNKKERNFRVSTRRQEIYSKSLGKGKVISNKYPGVYVTRGDIRYLNKSKAKYSKKGLVFVSENEKNKPIYLEDIKPDSGLKHIQARHSVDFKKKFKTKNKDIPKFLKDAIVKGDIKYKKTKGNITAYRTRKDGVKIATGRSGYIITAYPYDE